MVANFRHGSSKPSTVAGFADWMARTERWLRQLDNRVAAKSGGSGEKGDPGVGVADIVEEPAGTLTFEMTDGTEEGPFELPPGPMGPQGPVGPAGAGAAPVGCIIMWATSTPPTGWLICNGGTIDAATYPELVDVLGGTTLPDLRGRFPFGPSSSRPLLSRGGSMKIAASQMPSHSHGMGHNHGSTGGQSANHTHVFPVQYYKTTTTGGTAIRVTDIGNSTGGDGTSVQARSNVASTSHTHTVGGASSTTTGNAGSGSDYLPPYVGLHFIIRATAEETA